MLTFNRICLLVCLFYLGSVTTTNLAMEQLKNGEIIHKEEKKCNGHIVKSKMPWLFKLIRTGKDEVSTIKTVIDFCGGDVNEEYQYSTPLIEAVAVGSKPLVRMLHHYGALLEPETGGRRLTPLKKAVECESLSMVKLLVENLGAQVDYADPFYKETALYGAVARAQIPIWNRKKLLPIIKFLVQNGADPKKENCRNLTPLWQAEMTNDTEIIELLTSKN